MVERQPPEQMNVRDFSERVERELAVWNERTLATTCPKCGAKPKVACWNMSDRRNRRAIERHTAPHRERMDAAGRPPSWITCG